jgi:predicted nucleotidyltransferase
MSRYTVEGSSEAEERVARDLARILAEVRARGGEELLAVFLLGGYARGEGAVVRDAAGTLRGFNDYDLLLVFRAPAPPAPYRALARDLARELGIDFVDLGLATPRDLANAPPTLFWYELGEAHRVLWRRDGGPAPRRIPGDRLDPAEGPRLLLNRGLALLWAGLRLWPDSAPDAGLPAADPAEIRFAVIASHKAVLAAGDAALLGAGRYDLRQPERERLLAAEPALWSAWAPQGFLDAYREAAAFRRRPVLPGGAEAVLLWRRGRTALQAGFRAWGGGAAFARPSALRGLARRLRGEPPEEARLFAGLDALLLGDISGDAAWRRRGLALVRAWHP